MTVFPAVLDPACMFMGRALIVAGVPGVMVVVVAMIPANPHGFPVGARPAALVNKEGGGPTRIITCATEATGNRANESNNASAIFFTVIYLEAG